LGREEVGVLGEATHHIGREGRLMLPLLPGQRSKVRLSIGGVDTELVAICDENQAIPAGTRVMVVGLRGMQAIVQPSSNVLDDSKSDDANLDKEET
jgi:membrane protein implicated in regulation of membrane protease activity